MRRLLLVTGLLLTAGCTATENGTPTTGDQPTTTTTTTTTTTAETQIRPRDIDMAGVDVCGLVAALPLTTFGLDQRPPTGGESTSFPGSRDCFANGIAANLGLTLVAVVDEGAADYADGANAEVSVTEVDGFPLHVLKPPVPDSCFGALDVADGQMLYVNYGLSAPGEQPVTPQATLCERVPRIAAAALAQL
ncbi:DUF3558 family protein [Actinophytocola algeriensis]|uniref:DUF3558 domain-containing protein n=1 Tax=Actinophytocola algeriensis TaxID=1768010 RepID=A0A7W7VDS6_9PSEU|nr:DUF3558 family protein [Actinophytocola algeriensis]MBB4906496.1 hypothetical protein [Actinophytocola algeriensis]MBE1477977.1 hypothetical protein [Actinophytocola algeriensis]